MSPAGLDSRLLLYARTRGHPPWAEKMAATYSRTGEHAALWIALGLAGQALSRDQPDRVAWRRGLKIVLAAYGANYAVKLLVRRRRPELDRLPPLTGTV